MPAAVLYFALALAQLPGAAACPAHEPQRVHRCDQTGPARLNHLRGDPDSLDRSYTQSPRHNHLVPLTDEVQLVQARRQEEEKEEHKRRVSWATLSRRASSLDVAYRRRSHAEVRRPTLRRFIRVALARGPPALA